MALAQITSTLAVNAHRVLDITVNTDNDVVITLHYDGGTKTVTAANTSVLEVAKKVNAQVYTARRLNVQRQDPCGFF